DGSRLMLGELSQDGNSLKAVKQITGDENVATFQPVFSPDGSKLAWLQNNSEFDDLLLLDLETDTRKTLLENQPLMLPAWVQGQRTFTRTNEGKSIIYLLNQQGTVNLHEITFDPLQIKNIETSEFTLVEQPTLSTDGSLAFIAQSASLAPRIALLKDGKLRVIARSAPDVLGK